MHVLADMNAAAKAEQAERAKPAAPVAVAGNGDSRSNGSDSAGADRAFVKMWTVDELKPAFPEGFDRRRSLQRGHEVFTTAGCVKCHWFRGEGVKSAPDLGEIAKKYQGAELLRQVLEPSATILEGFENHVFEMKSGDLVIARIVKEEPDGWRVVQNLQEPDKVELLKKGDVKSEQKSKLSPMPTGLLVTFTRDEIVDLIAFLQSPANEAETGTKGESKSDAPPPSH
jgi:putative heme-binding domain-containing protein